MSAEGELRTRLAAAGADATAVDRLVAYVHLLELWSPRHSLVRFRDRRELLDRHVLESLAALDRLEGGGRLVDVGSGAGLPGIPLLACRPQWSGVLVEPRQKRWAFLKEAVRATGVTATVACCRFQNVELPAPVDLVTVRALTVDGDLLAWARSALSAAGRVLVWGTPEVEAALRAHPGWRVLSSPVATLERGRLIDMEPCFT